MRIRNIKKINLEGKRVLCRLDFDVPLKNKVIKNDFRLKKQLPTLELLLKKKAKIIILAHLGRPRNLQDRERLSLKPVASWLRKELGKRVKFVPGKFDLSIGAEVDAMKNSSLLMLDNIRFNKGEMTNSAVFAKELAKLADIYVNNAFAVSHRTQASIAKIKNYLPAYAGLLLEEELTNLQKIIRPKKPLVVVLGGAKVKTKMPILKAFENKAWRILLGGMLANNFYVARGYKVGLSSVDKESVTFAKKIRSKKIILPPDVLTSQGHNNANATAKRINEVNEKDYIFDIGPKSIKLYTQIIKKSHTLVWNGPMGFFELNNFRYGTLSIAREIASLSTRNNFAVVGGGETVQALAMTKMQESVDWISTGGGAMLVYLGGGNMPGLKKIIY